MQYDKRTGKHELVLLGHMCSIRIEITETTNFFNYAANNKLKYTMSATQIGAFFFVSMYFSTEELAQQAYKILLNWNP